MFFSIHVGRDRDRWQRAVEDHARWLGLSVSCCRFGSVDVAELSGRGAVSQMKLLDSTLDNAGTASSCIEFTQCNGATDRLGGKLSATSRVLCDVSGESVRLIVPAAAPEQIVYSITESSFVLANDLRIVGRLIGGVVDQAAICSLLIYGAIPAPLTILSGVSRAMPGQVTSISLPGGSVIRERMQFGQETSGSVTDFENRLDLVLGAVPESSVLTFSGGVDSGLLAARLAALGRKDVALFNYSFGGADAEAAHAREVGKQIGLRFEQAQFDSNELASGLGEIGRDYSFPFSDFSTMATNMLLRSVVSTFPDLPCVVDGTGADGSFGLGPLVRWRQLYKVPMPIRRAIGSLFPYMASSMQGGRVEGWLQSIYRSTRMSLPEASAAANNSLEGIVYRVPLEVRRGVSELVLQQAFGIVDFSNVWDQLSWVDVVHTCGGVFASKGYDPLRMRGVRSLYPFLDPSVLEAAYSMSWSEKQVGSVTKAPLKASLASMIPEGLVYRAKAGFTPPIVGWIQREPLRSVFLEVAQNLGPFADFVDRRRFARLVCHAVHGRALPFGVKHLLWTVAFVSLWLDQQPWLGATSGVGVRQGLAGVVNR